MKKLILLACILCSALGVSATGDEKGTVKFIPGYLDENGFYHSGYYIGTGLSEAILKPDRTPVKDIIPLNTYKSESESRSTTNNVGGHLPTALPNMTFGQRSNGNSRSGL